MRRQRPAEKAQIPHVVRLLELLCPGKCRLQGRTSASGKTTEPLREGKEGQRPQVRIWAVLKAQKTMLASVMQACCLHKMLTRTDEITHDEQADSQIVVAHQQDRGHPCGTCPG
jgi:hypothetical protein